VVVAESVDDELRIRLGECRPKCIVGVVITVGVHPWRRNAVLSILAGTIACLVLTNLPH